MAANRHTHNFRKCSHASVGLAQASPNHTCWFKDHEDAREAYTANTYT